MRFRILRGPTLPRHLSDLARPPEAIYLWGVLPPRPYVALVGSRKVTTEGFRHARQLAKELGGAGVTIISGGAAGIDAAAHEGALDANAPTLVVAPCGFEKPYPAGHQELFQRVVAGGGGYIALSADEQRVRTEHFHRRNSVLAALCDALVMGEANVKSGSRNAAMHARRLGRAVFAVPSAPWNELGRGSNQELRGGARWAEGARDVLRYLEETGQRIAVAQDLAEEVPQESPQQGATGRGGPQRRRRSSRSPQTTAQAPRQLGFQGLSSGAPAAALAAVEGALRAGRVHVDAICEHTALDAGTVNVALLELTLRGDARVDDNGLLRWAGSARG